MEEGFRRILARLPFPVLQIHPDNGSEFFNHKNDNRFVERKKATLVRAYLGYDRLDTVAQTLAINQLYDKMWLYFDFFSRRDP